jgi:hypothetical protein
MPTEVVRVHCGWKKDMDDSNPKLQFRVNGVIIPRLSVRREIVPGKGKLTPSGKPQIVIHDRHLGAMALDDNLPRFVVEVRDIRCAKWRRVTVAKLLAILETERGREGNTHPR